MLVPESRMIPPAPVASTVYKLAGKVITFCPTEIPVKLT